MKRILLIAAVLSIFLISSTSSSANPGITASVDLSLLEEAKDAYLAEIIKTINGLKIANQPFNDGYFNDNKLTVTQAARDAHFKVKGDVFYINIDKFSVNFFSANFRQSLWFIPITGFCRVTMNDSKLRVGVKLTTQKFKDRTIASLQVIDAEFKVNGNRLTFDLGGGFMADFIEIFIPLFKGRIQQDIENSIATALRNDLPKSLNKLLLQQGGVVQFWQFEQFKDLYMDYNIESPPKFEGDYIGCGFNGTFYNQNKTYYVPQIKHNTMPFHNKDLKSRIQVFLSDYFLESLAHAGLEDFQFGFAVKHDEVPAYFPFQLTTSALDTYFAGLVETFGRDVPVNMNFTIVDIEQFDIIRSKQKIIAEVDFFITLIVAPPGEEPKIAGTMEFNNTAIDFTLEKRDLQILATLNDLEISHIYVNSKYLGKLDVSIMRSFFNLALNAAVPFFNIFFSQYYIQIPDTVFNLFKVKDVTMTYYDHYIELGVTPEFIPVQKVVRQSLIEHHRLFEPLQ